MNFLDSTGLEYFYGKLKEKFIRSVNSYTPDANGNVTITNVATADNLASPDGQTIYDTFIYRTSGGRASISNGEAQLIYIDGNVDIVGRVQESLAIDVENNIQATCDITTWRNQIDETGTYNFTYIRPSSGQGTSSWNPGIGTWRYNDSIVSLSTFGIECFNIIAPSIIISTTGANIRNLQVIPNSWIGTFETDGTYVFVYNGESWILEGESISLVGLGISMSGTVEEGDEIIVNYQSGTPNSILTVSYIAPEQGTILVSKPTAFESTGFNQFDKDSMYIQDASIVNGKIASNSGTYIAYCHAKGGVDNGYVAYSANAYIRNIGWCANLPTIDESVVTTGGSSSGTLASIPFNEDGYVVVVVTNISDLCIHPKWSGIEDTKYEDYVAPDVITLPTTSIDSQALPLNSYGMPAVGNVADRLNLDAGFYIQNIGQYDYSDSNLEYVQGLGVDYDYDATNIFYVLNDPIIYSVDVDSIYNVNDFGTEEFLNTLVAVKAYMLYGQNLRDKLRIGVVEKGGDTMTGDLSIQSSEPYFKVKNSEISSTTTVNESRVIGGYTSYYSNDDFSGYAVWRLNTDGSVEFDLRSRKMISGARKDNQLRLIVNADGSNSVTVTDPAAWRTALNVVNKSGDTMNDSLNIKTTKPYINFIATGNKIGTKPSGNMYSALSFYATDTTKNVGLVGQRQTATKAQQLYMYVKNLESTANDTQNALTIGVNADGTRTVQVSDPAVWREALGIKAFQLSANTSSTITFRGNGCFVFGARGDTSFVAAIDYWFNAVNVLPIGSGGAGVTITKAANAHSFTIRNTRSSGAIVGAIIPAGLVVDTTSTT